MIRTAIAQDISDLIDLGVKAIDESGHPAKLDRKKTRDMLIHALMLQRKNGPMRIWVLEVQSKVVGVLIGQIDTLYYSKAKYATDLVTYVLPEHRGRGVMLIKAFVRWAKRDQKVVDITLQQSSGIAMEKTERIYQRLGFKRVGACYVHYRGE